MAQFLDIIILLLVVIVIYNKLRSLLGTRPEQTKVTPLSEESAAKIFDIIMQENEKNNQPITQDITPEEDLSPIEKDLRQIPNFDKEIFINGAKRAFEIILTAFAKGDIETLEPLVSPKLLKKFQEILNQRQLDKITAETDLICFNKAEIINAKISKNNIVKIVVNFVTEQVNLLKDKQDKVIEGDENFVQTIADTWTFERCLTSTNPNWLLISTKKNA
ncbi:MAG: Tim44 domain-containing protein [Alphaproteobacteria bacterium]|nr:Tim44 domain-containing protein [Alphaproteobacteria bacterium]